MQLPAIQNTNIFLALSKLAENKNEFNQDEKHFLTGFVLVSSGISSSRHTRGMNFIFVITEKIILPDIYEPGRFIPRLS